MHPLRILLPLLLLFLSYSVWLYSPSARSGRAASPLADQGKLVWQEYNCNACHQLYGLGGYLGPDLTHVYSTRGPAHIRALLPVGVSSMPRFQLSEKETDALLAFLALTDESGHADPRTFSTTWYGNITPRPR